MTANDWIVCDATTGELWCMRCGDREPLPLLISVDDLPVLAEAFVEMHEECKEKEPTP